LFKVSEPAGRHDLTKSPETAAKTYLS